LIKYIEFLEKLEAKLNVKLLLYGLEGRKKLSAQVTVDLENLKK